MSFIPHPLSWNRYTKVIRSSVNGEVDHAMTNKFRERMGLPVPWTKDMTAKELAEPPMDLTMEGHGYTSMDHAEPGGDKTVVTCSKCGRSNTYGAGADMCECPCECGTQCGNGPDLASELHGEDKTVTAFSVDTSEPVPGPYRMPTENERRCRVYLKKHYRDCVDLCEVHPDIAERTDATMRLFVASWDMRELLKRIVADLRRDGIEPQHSVVATKALAILQFIAKG